MASRASKIAAVAREIFGTLPIRGVRTGMQYLKTPLTGAYESRFYMEPIEPIARKRKRHFFGCMDKYLLLRVVIIADIWS